MVHLKFDDGIETKEKGDYLQPFNFYDTLIVCEASNFTDKL